MDSTTPDFSPPADPHALPADAVLARLGVSAGPGLTENEAERRRNAVGPNAIAARREASALAILLHQFASPVVYLLSGAAALAFGFGEWDEGLAIIAVLAINTLIGFGTEIKAARSIEALRAMGTRSARVRREGRTRSIPAEDLVPGDVVVLEAGDSVAADLRLVEASNLAADESTLTGESVAVEKSTAAVAADCRPADRTSMLFKGTSVTHGAGTGVVVATGLATELGQISRLVEEAEAGSSPLEKKLARLSGQLVWATAALTVVIGGVGLATGKDAFLMIEAAIALAVAAIPEGLPIVATLALARGMWRMARRNALIERLSAVETLGATTVILTDKTGTLTENRMTVRRLWTPSGEIDLSRDPAAGLGPEAAELIEIAVLCNGAALGADGDGGDNGDPMELALLRAGRLAGIEQADLLRACPALRTHAFDVAHKMMATLHRRDGRVLVAVKGAPEAVLAQAVRAGAEPMDATARAAWHERVEALGAQGLRVIACASRLAGDADADPYADLRFLGLIGLEDPPRADVPEAIADCRRSGIRVAMITGDHAVTARAIGRAVGLDADGGRVIEGAELSNAGPDEILNTRIFARVSPAEKLSLVRAYQSAGEVVAMTGDGVNDAPALKQADIGIAMGLRGTDVAREAAAMILLDDAFPTIVRAVREGRVIFGNIRRFVTFLLACNLAEVLVVGLAILSALPLPLLPLQILYLNLVTDVFPAFALAMGEGASGVLNRPPRHPREPILGRAQWMTIILHSLGLAAATFGALALAHAWLALDGTGTITVTFLTLAFGQLWHVFNMRGARSCLLSNEITRNPWIWAALAACAALLIVPAHLPPLARMLQLTVPTPAMWAVILGMSLAPLMAAQAVMTIVKATRRRAA